MLPVVTATVGWLDPPRKMVIPKERAIAIIIAKPRRSPNSIIDLYLESRGNICHERGSSKEFLEVSLD
jgi:hypothetical protein